MSKLTPREKRDKLASEIGKRARRITRPGQGMVGLPGGSSIIPSRSTKFLHVLAEYIENYRKVESLSETKSAKGKIELSNGEVVEDEEYLETWFRVTVYLKEFTIFGKKFKWKYTYNTDFRRVSPQTFLPGISEKTSTFLYKAKDSRRKYHIKNEEVTKEEYEAHKKQESDNE